MQEILKRGLARITGKARKESKKVPEMLTFYAGRKNYDYSSRLHPPCVFGGDCILPCDPEEAIRTHLQKGTTLNTIAWYHAKRSKGWSPGISLTPHLETAVGIVRGKSQGEGGVVVEVEVPRDEVISIEELYQKGGWTLDGLTEEQIEREREHVYLGGMKSPDDKYKPLVVKQVHQVSPER